MRRSGVRVTLSAPIKSSSYVYLSVISFAEIEKLRTFGTLDYSKSPCELAATEESGYLQYRPPQQPDSQNHHHTPARTLQAGIGLK